MAAPPSNPAMAAMADPTSVMEPVMSLADTVALPLILQHPSVLQQQQVIILLMATSKALQQAVKTWCGGAVAITVKRGAAASRPAIESFSSFVARHGSIMSSLRVRVGDDFDGGAALTSALEYTAAHNGTLQLQSLNTDYASAALLQRLCSRSLLNLATFVIRDCSAAGAALAALTNLRRLKLTVAYPELWPALPALSNLKELEVSQLQDKQNDLECFLPAQLRSLTVPGSWHQPGHQLQLGHLTALTGIWSGRSNSSGFSVHQGDVLPPALQHLDAHGVACAQPLLALKQLRSLSVWDCRCSAGQLAELGSSLAALSAVTLSFWSSQRAAAAAAGLPELPVRSLWLGSASAAPLPLATLQEVGLLGGALTCLNLTCRLGATADQLASVLSRLSQLQELSIWKPDLAASSSVAAGLANLLRAVAGLLNLGCLTLSGLQCSRLEELALLAAAGRQGWPLTSLVLSGMPGLDDACVAACVSGLGSLAALDLSWNAGVGDDALLAVAGCLQRLTQLHVLGTSVTDRGVQGLSRLRHLRDLSVPERVGAAARAHALMNGSNDDQQQGDDE